MIRNSNADAYYYHIFQKITCNYSTLIIVVYPHYIQLFQKYYFKIKPDFQMSSGRSLSCTESREEVGGRKQKQIGQSEGQA